MEENQVNRTIEILQTNPSRYNSKDRTLLTDLKTQFILFFSNFEGATNTEEKQEEVRISNAINYLTQTINSSSTQHNNSNAVETTTTQHEINDTVHIKERNGKKIYYLGDKPIRFKVLKNKPKNGDFKVRWNRNFDSLKDFKERFGHLHVTRSTSSYEELGNWVAEQRRKLKRGKITLEQFHALNELGFEWDRSYYFHNTYQKKRKL